MTRALLLFLVIAPAASLAPVAPAAAQERVPGRFATAEPGEISAIPSQPSFRPMRIAKWSTAALTAAVAGIGLVAYTRADDRYRALERTCVEDPDACAERLPNGAYADPQLEAMYQEVLRYDTRARLALIGSQLGLAASVVLFVLDLRDDSTPPNIPYDPRALRVAPGRDGGVELGFGVPVGR